MKEIIQINYDQNLQKSMLDYVHQWAFTQLAQNTGKILGEEEEEADRERAQKALIAEKRL